MHSRTLPYECALKMFVCNIMRRTGTDWWPRRHAAVSMRRAVLSTAAEADAGGQCRRAAACSSGRRTFVGC